MSSYLDTFRRYLEFEKRYSPHTVGAYISDVESFMSYAESTYEMSDPADIQHMHIRSWMVELLEQGMTPKSVNRKLSSLRTWYRLMRKLGTVTTNPLARIQAPRSGKSLPHVVEVKSLEALRKGEDNLDEFSGLRDITVLELLYGLGLRQAELLSLRVEDIDLERRHVRVTGKRRKERIVPFGDVLYKAIGRYLDKRRQLVPGDSGILILTDRGKPGYPKMIYRIVNRYLGSVSTVARRSPHVLRHSYATHMLEAGAGIEAIKELLGHASLAATQVYTHTSVERLKRTYQAAHPKA
jgi:integrase/recombinase XerC